MLLVLAVEVLVRDLYEAMDESRDEESRGALQASRLAWLVTGPLLLIATLRLVAHDAWMPLVWLNAFSLYLYLPAYAALAVGLFLRRPRLIVAAALLVVCHLVWVLPDFSPASSEGELPDEAPRLRLFSANLLMINDRPAGILGEIERADADVVLLQELSPRWEVALEAAGVFGDYPHRVGVVRADSFGTAILSRTPLTDAEVWDVHGTPMARATIDVGGRSLRLVSVHTLPPIIPDYARLWNAQLRSLLGVAGSAPLPLVLVGDFNATQHTAWLQRLTSGELHSAHVECGRGHATTYPNGLSPAPPIRLDHALLSSELRCLSIREGEGEGSDHRPLIVDLALAGGR